MIKLFLLLLLLPACGHEQHAQPTKVKPWGTQTTPLLRELHQKADNLPTVLRGKALEYFESHKYPLEVGDFVLSHYEPEAALAFLQSLRNEMEVTRANVDASRDKPASDLDVLRSLPAGIRKFLRRHPLGGTRGIFSKMLAEELGVNTISWGKYLNEDKHLETLQISQNMRIFLGGDETPKERVASVAAEYRHARGAPLNTTGVLLADVAANPSIMFRQLDWDEGAFHMSISHLLDRSLYVTEHMNVGGGKVETSIFATGDTPRQQLATALKSYDEDDFKQGVPIAEVAEKLSYRQDDWDEHAFHQSIGHLLDRSLYATESMNVGGGKVETSIFATGDTPRQQLATALKSYDEDDFKQGVPIAEVAEKLSYRHDDWDEAAFHKSIGHLLDKSLYATEGMNVGGKIEKYIFTKGDTPRQQLATALKSYDEDDFKQGVPIAEVAEKLSYRHDDWDEHAFHQSISHLLDRSLYVTEHMNVGGGKVETSIFATGDTPRQQLATALKSYDEDDFKQGVPMAEVAAKLSYRQDDWDERAFHTSIGHLLDESRYVTEQVVVGGKVETRIFLAEAQP